MTYTVGITAEYNPFHNGHVYQIQTVRDTYKPDYIIAVMSGNFVQRGEPACIDKFTRAAAACRNGIDVVLELPYVYAVQSASRFAHGAVSILKKAGVQAISFGSECGDLENLRQIAALPINPDHIRESMAQGMSFPKAYSLLTAQMMPNDRLGVCYLQEIADTKIEPLLLQRTTNYLDPLLHPQTSSALAIRKAVAQGKAVDQATVMAKALYAWPRMTLSAYYPYIRTFLLTAPPAYLASLFLFSEGIENHLSACARKAASWQDFLSSAITHRYTASRIRRTVLQVLTHTTAAEIQSLPPLHKIRVLAFNQNGRRWLKACRKAEIPIASRFAAMPKAYRDMEYRAALAYAFPLPEHLRTKLLKNEIGGAMAVEE